jgi:hypothetical protein
VTIIILTAIIAYVGSWTLKFKTTDEMNAFLSRGGTELADFEKVKQQFGAGSVFPYSIVFVLEQNNEINEKNNFTTLLDNPSSFDVAHFVLNSIANISGFKTSISNFQGIYAIGGELISYQQVQACLKYLPNNNNNNGTLLEQDEEPPYVSLLSNDIIIRPKQQEQILLDINNNNDNCDPNVYSMLMSNMTLSANRQATVVTFISDIDPTGNQGEEYYNKILEAVDLRPQGKNSKSEETPPIAQIQVPCRCRRFTAHTNTSP